MTAWKLYMKSTELGISGIKKGIDNMKTIVRRGTFETNSSSVHSLVICSEETYNKWVADEVTYSMWQDKFSEACEITEEIKQKAKKKYEANKKAIGEIGMIFLNKIKKNVILKLPMKINRVTVTPMKNL